jgi:transmembrane sensor
LSRPLISPGPETLPDGSIMERRGPADILIEFTPEERRIILRHGSAFFAVAKNPARPFVVVAGGIEVRAVGTAFSVDLGRHTVEVAVTEGRIAVELPAPGPEHSSAKVPSVNLALVDAGNRVIVENVRDAGAVAKPGVMIGPLLRDAPGSKEVARLEFSGTSLAETVRMFNEYGRVRLRLQPALARLQVSGRLRADDFESLALLLKNEFEIEAVPGRGGEIYLRR